MIFMIREMSGRDCFVSDSAMVAESLVRVFGGDRCAAVGDVPLAVDYGHVHALPGPNGAGKTTTVRMCSTLLKPSSGAWSIDGIDAIRHPERARGVQRHRVKVRPPVAGRMIPDGFGRGVASQGRIRGEPRHSQRGSEGCGSPRRNDIAGFPRLPHVPVPM